MERVNYQNVLFNVRDVDTFEIIDADFTLYLYPIDMGNLRTVKCGSSRFSNIPVVDNFVTIGLHNTDAIIEAGYDPNTLTGSYIEFTKVEDPAFTISYMPWEVNLFLKKLA